MRERGESIRQAVDKSRDFFGDKLGQFAEATDQIAKDSLSPNDALVMARIFGASSVAIGVGYLTLDNPTGAFVFNLVIKPFNEIPVLKDTPPSEIAKPVFAAYSAVGALIAAKGVHSGSSGKEIPFSTYVLPQAARGLRAVGNKISIE